MHLLLALHSIATKRGDGLRPELLALLQLSARSELGDSEQHAAESQTPLPTATGEVVTDADRAGTQPSGGL
jgi:hypothetical protein